MNLLFRFPNRPDNWNEIGKRFSQILQNKTFQVPANFLTNVKVLKVPTRHIVIWIMTVIGDIAKHAVIKLMQREIFTDSESFKRSLDSSLVHTVLFVQNTRLSETL